jgi:large repetitive protein
MLRFSVIALVLACEDPLKSEVDESAIEEEDIGGEDDDTDSEDVGEGADPDGDGYTDDDCDSDDPDVNPGAEEICDGIDNDCDGETDEDVLETFYSDVDGDGYGDPDTEVSACEQPSGHTRDAGDCDDGSAEVNPEALEICNGMDDDCDGDTDDEDESLDPGSVILFAADADGDTWLSATDYIGACTAPEGYFDASDPVAPDCDDTDAAINPQAAEICDGIDNDCDERTDDEDESLDASTGTEFFLDSDSDGAGDPDAGAWMCGMPAGYATAGDDCDDGNDDISPAAEEVCDGIDNDCDGDTDDEDGTLDASTGTEFFLDADSDGAGDPDSSAWMCGMAAGYATAGDDCDDGNDDISPAAEEVCDGIDNDCDGDTDDEDGSLDSSTGTEFFLDADSDGAGDPDEGAWMCGMAEGYAAAGDDCDDGNTDVSPSAEEVCDGIDNDCNGDTDDNDGSLDASTGTEFFLDADSDGAGDPAEGAWMCGMAEGYVTAGDDCDDGEAAAHPGGTEVCDGHDNDCDGLLDDEDPDNDPDTSAEYYADADGDGYGIDSDTVSMCSPTEGYATYSGDCDEEDVDVNPGASEICDTVDNDCDGDTDDEDDSLDASTGTEVFADSDGDGDGDPDSPVWVCTLGDGQVESASDCDDSDPNLEGIDGDGDGSSLCGGDCDDSDPLDVLDSDNDGYSLCSGDCDDGDSDLSPGVDGDSDGIDSCTDEDDSVPNYVPVLGTWDIVDYELTEDECDLSAFEAVLYDAMPASMEVNDASDTELSMSLMGGGSTTCPVSGDTFDCDTLSYIITTDFGTANADFTISGDIESNTEIYQYIQVDVTSVSGTLSFLVSPPCTLHMEASSAAQ